MEGIWLASYLLQWVLIGLLAFVVFGLMRQIGELRLRVGEEREVGISCRKQGAALSGERVSMGRLTWRPWLASGCWCSSSIPPARPARNSLKASTET